MYEEASRLINEAKRIIIIQAENPDGDSLGSSLALEEILGDLGKDFGRFLHEFATSAFDSRWRRAKFD